MKILRTLLIILVLLISTVVILGLVLPGSFKVERTLNMERPPAVIYQQVADFHNWPKWSPWQEKDSTMESTFSGNPSGLGAKMAWTGNPEMIGKGEMEFIEAIENERLRSNIRFIEPWESNSFGFWRFEAIDDNTTKVSWGSEGDLSFSEKLAFLFMGGAEKMMGPDFERGLENLNSVVEALPETIPLKIEEQMVESKKIAVILKETDRQNIALALSESYGALMSFMESGNTAMAGPPFTIFRKYSPDTIVMDVGIPIAGDAAGRGNIRVIDSYSGKTLTAIHWGGYDLLNNTYEALQSYSERNNYESNGDPWEVYLTDPTIESDTTKWMTAIYFPVK